MRTTLTLTALVACLSAVSATPQRKGEGFIGQANEGNNTACDPSVDREYILMLQKDEHPDATQILARMNKTLEDDDVLWSVNNDVFAAMSVMTDGCTIEGFNAMSEVAYYEEKTTIQSFVTQNQGAPWGLQRISNEAGASGSPQGQDFTYSFDDEALGAGVDIYVIDTGVRTSHAVFTGRATEGFSFTGSAADGDGHGTHVAGTAAGAKFGVAQAANIFAVKVLGDDGSGSSSDTIAGMDWVINNHNKRKTEPGFVGSIMSMSWGLQGTARAVDEVITGASEAGIHVSVAAGNDGVDACGSTPAHLGGSNSNVVTVGSVNIQNSVSSFSNIGTCVDIYAPGEQILSAWNTGDTIINFLSGTSMACPHTTGVMAYLMAQDAAKFGQDPGALKQALLSTARQDKIEGNLGGTANLLLSNGVDGGVTARRLTKNYVVPDRTGSPAARAAGAVSRKAQVDKRWSVHSEVAELRF